MPATLLQTSEVTENGLPEVAYPQMTEIEVAKPDFNKFTDLARASAGVSPPTTSPSLTSWVTVLSASSSLMVVLLLAMFLLVLLDLQR